MAEHPEDPGRSFVYRWLAQFYLGPTDQTALARYREEDGRALLSQCATVPSLREFAAALKVMTDPKADLKIAQGRIASAFSLAFDMGGPKSAPPFASVYLSECGLLLQQPARDMARLLRQLEMSLPDGFNEPPDHLGMELNVMAELIDRDAAKRGLPLAQATFLEQHLLSWLPAFAARCHKLRTPAFYGVLADAVHSFARADLDAITDRHEAG